MTVHGAALHEILRVVEPLLPPPPKIVIAFPETAVQARQGPPERDEFEERLARDAMDPIAFAAEVAEDDEQCLVILRGDLDR